MNKDIINFNLEADKLKKAPRTGWSEVGINSSRLESVSEHVAGCLYLLLSLEGNNKLSGVDTSKVVKMIAYSELEKIDTNREDTPIKHLSKDERNAKGLATIERLTSSFENKDEIKALLEEYSVGTTKEAIVAKEIGKFESDIQAKKYDLDGEFDLDKAIEDAKKYPEDLAEKIVPAMKNASDGWLSYDSMYYKDDTFKGLSEDLKNITK